MAIGRGRPHSPQSVRWNIAGFPCCERISLRRDCAHQPQSVPIFRMSPVSLATLRKGARGVVVDVRDDAQSLGDEAQSTVSRRLLELGFVPGEAFEVVEEIWPGGDPMAVRLGNTTFALRRREASAVIVETDLSRIAQ